MVNISGLQEYFNNQQFQLAVGNLAKKMDDLKAIMQSLEVNMDLDETNSLLTTNNNKIDSVNTNLASLITALNSVLTDLTSIQGYIDQVETYVDGLETLMNTVTTSLSSLNSAVNTVDTHVDGIETLLTDIKGYVDQLEGYVDSLETYLNPVEGEYESYMDVDTTSTTSKTFDLTSKLVYPCLFLSCQAKSNQTVTNAYLCIEQTSGSVFVPLQSTSYYVWYNGPPIYVPSNSHLEVIIQTSPAGTFWILWVGAKKILRYSETDDS